MLSTHAHFDHDATERPNGQMILDRMTGTYGFADVNVEGLADKHQCEAPGWYKWTDSMAPRLGTARVAAEPSEKTASVVIQDAKDLGPSIQQL